MARTSKKKRGRPKGSRNKKFSMAGLTNYKMSDTPEIGLLPIKSKWIKPKKNKLGTTLRIRLPDDYQVEDRNKLHIATEPASFISRLEAATVKYEQAIKEAITALKGQ